MNKAIKEVIFEMRERKVGSAMHGKNKSPTLHRWADRIESALEVKDLLLAEASQCLFVMREIGSMDAEEISGDDVDLRFEDSEGRDTGCDVSIVEYAEKSAFVIEQLLAIIAGDQQ